MTEVLPPVTDGGEDQARLDSLRAQYRTLQDMEGRQAAIRAEIQGISSIAEPGPDDLAWQGTLIREHDDLDTLAEPLRKRAKDLDRVLRARTDPANTEAGSDAVARTPDLATRNLIGGDPFAEVDRVRRGLVEAPTVRGWALDAIELAANRGDLTHEWAEETTAKTETHYFGQANIAKHILETGSQEYLDAFRAYLNDPQGETRRAALSLTNANGGYLLPFVLDQVAVA